MSEPSCCSGRAVGLSFSVSVGFYDNFFSYSTSVRFGMGIWGPLGVNLTMGKVALAIGTAALLSADISLAVYVAVNPIQLLPSVKQSK